MGTPPVSYRVSLARSSSSVSCVGQYGHQMASLVSASAIGGIAEAIMFSERKPLDFAHLITVPRSSGCYIIYDIAGPIYVGRSGSDIRARLQSHFRGTGSRNIAFALRVGAGASLYFRYCGLPKAA